MDPTENFHQGGEFHPSHPWNSRNSLHRSSGSTIPFPESQIQRIPIPLPAAIPAIPREKIPFPHPPNPQNSQFFPNNFPFSRHNTKDFSFSMDSVKGGVGAAGRFSSFQIFPWKTSELGELRAVPAGLESGSALRGSGIQGLGFTLD